MFIKVTDQMCSSAIFSKVSTAYTVWYVFEIKGVILSQSLQKTQVYSASTIASLLRHFKVLFE